MYFRCAITLHFVVWKMQRPDLVYFVIEQNEITRNLWQTFKCSIRSFIHSFFFVIAFIFHFISFSLFDFVVASCTEIHRVANAFNFVGFICIHCWTIFLIVSTSSLRTFDSVRNGGCTQPRTNQMLFQFSHFTFSTFPSSGCVHS